TIGIVFWPCSKKSLHWILMNIVSEFLIFRSIPHPPVKKTCLPNLTSHSEVLSHPERIPAFNQLQRPFQCDARWSNDEMQVIGHQNKLMQQIFPFFSVVVHHVQKQPRILFYLK